MTVTYPETPWLVTFLTAGDPNPKLTLEYMLILEKYSDIIELGVPFSDPMADGPTIQKANVRSLKAGTKIRDVFNIVKEFREHSKKPVILMTYYNPVYARGIENFVREASECGITGMIVVDLPLEESEEYLKACEKAGMDTVFLAAPNTPDDRLRMIDEASSAFVYLVSLFGTTGARDNIPDTAFKLIGKAKKVCRKPVCVGFGVSKKEHVKSLVDAGADGVVVGSAIVKLIEEFGNDAHQRIDSFVSELRKGLSNK
ncbi:MAG: tryptophan synthase subunit alpha [Archaeoglobus sp.]|nr:MAG: tryptophan synthase subunit alpha [Archaeoglobus sp.]